MVSDGRIRELVERLGDSLHWLEVALREGERGGRRRALSEAGAAAELATQRLVEWLREDC